MTPETPIRPDYERPPLVEQAISVSFEQIAGFSIVDSGLFWSELRREFPDVSTEARLETMVETFDDFKPSNLTFNLITAPPTPRAMFRNRAGELIQLQEDRFGFNWAKIGTAEYPRSEKVMKRFVEYFGRFCRYLSSRDIEVPALTQCELTNLNIIPVTDFGKDFSDVTEALNVDPLDLGLPYLQAETFVRTRQHRIIGRDKSPIGRLHISIAPVISNADRSKAFRFELTARSAPGLGTPEAAQSFFDTGRNAINGAFQALVTDKMKATWGEKR